MEYEYIGDKYKGSYLKAFYLRMNEMEYLGFFDSRMNYGCQVIETETAIVFGELEYQERGFQMKGVEPIIMSVLKYGYLEDFIKAVDNACKEVEKIYQRRSGLRIYAN